MNQRWQSIDSATKDGSDILVYCEDTGEQMVAFWREEHSGWQVAYYAPQRVALGCHPTHCMELPEPPKS